VVGHAFVMEESPAHKNAVLRKPKKRRLPGTKRARVSDDHLYQIDSDLCGDMAVSANELRAIARLLGEEIEKIFSDIS
jgi:hypothetical protein